MKLGRFGLKRYPAGEGHWMVIDRQANSRIVKSLHCKRAEARSIVKAMNQANEIEQTSALSVA